MRTRIFLPCPCAQNPGEPVHLSVTLGWWMLVSWLTPFCPAHTPRCLEALCSHLSKSLGWWICAWEGSPCPSCLRALAVRSTALLLACNRYIRLVLVGFHSKRVCVKCAVHAPQALPKCPMHPVCYPKHLMYVNKAACALSASAGKELRSPLRSAGVRCMHAKAHISSIGFVPCFPCLSKRLPSVWPPCFPCLSTHLPSLTSYAGRHAVHTKARTSCTHSMHSTDLPYMRTNVYTSSNGISISMSPMLCLHPMQAGGGQQNGPAHQALQLAMQLVASGQLPLASIQLISARLSNKKLLLVRAA